MGGGRPKVEAPKPGPYEKELAKRMQRFAPYEEIILRESAWAWPGASAVGAPAAPTAPIAPVASAASSYTWPSSISPPKGPPYSKSPSGLLPQEQEYWKQIKDLPPWELYSLMQKEKGNIDYETGMPIYPGRYEMLKYAYEQKTKGPAVSTTSAAPSAPSTAPSTPPVSPTRPPTYLLAPYMEAIEREYSKAKEAISGMRPGGAKERAMLELEAYWKPQAKAAATRALYEEARATLASMVGAGYGPTLRTLVGLEQQRSALEYQQKAAAAQAAAAQQASMWQSLGSLAGLGILGLAGKAFGLFG